MSSFFGFNIQVSKDRPRYTLPAEVMPGVPWPAGFRDEFNEWAHSFLGVTNPTPRGTIYRVGQNTIVMNPHDYERMKRDIQL